MMMSKTKEDGVQDERDNSAVVSRAARCVENTAVTAEHWQEGEEDSHFIPPEKNGAMQPENGLDVTSKVGIKSDTGVGVPARYIFSVLGFLAFFLMYCLRTCPNVAMVAMINSTSSALDDNDNNITIVSVKCTGTLESSNETDTEYVDEEGEFAWNEKTQGLILGAFYYGYTILQLLGGWLADRVRGKRLLGGGLLLSSLLFFAVPSAARAGSSYLIAVRVAQGVVESAVYPAMCALCSRWIPVHERSKLVTFAYSGSEIGIVCGMLLTGFLSKYGFAGGWPSAFYVFGMLGCVWFLLWTVLVFESPAEHPRISDRERRYIQSSVGPKMTAATPWRAILTSAPVWGVCIAHFAFGWGYFSMLTSLPTYMKQILGFHIVTNGFLSALPYLTMWTVQVLSGVVADHMRRHCSTAFTRKVIFSIGCVLSACFLAGAGYVDCDYSLAVMCLTLGVTANGMVAATVLVNHLDLAPRFAGILFGMSNFWGTTSGFLAPYVIGVLTYQNQTLNQWRKFFYVTAGIYVISMASYWFLGRGELQPWAAPPLSSTVIPDPLLQMEKKEEEKPQTRMNV